MILRLSCPFFFASHGIFKKSVFAVDLAQDSEEVHRVDRIMVAQPVKPIRRNSIWRVDSDMAEKYSP